jgi:hypothetical protein
MFKRFEKWIKSMVADEVRKIDTDLQREKVALRSQVVAFDATFKAQLQAFDDAVKHLIDNSEPQQEVLRLRAHIAELNGHIAEVTSAFKQLHPVSEQVNSFIR